MENFCSKFQVPEFCNLDKIGFSEEAVDDDSQQNNVKKKTVYDINDKKLLYKTQVTEATLFKWQMVWQLNVVAKNYKYKPKTIVAWNRQVILTEAYKIDSSSHDDLLQLYEINQKFDWEMKYYYYWLLR